MRHTPCGGAGHLCPKKYLGAAIEIAGDKLSDEQTQTARGKHQGKRQTCVRLPRFLISMMGDSSGSARTATRRTSKPATNRLAACWILRGG
jgi:hypothetical protein